MSKYDTTYEAEINLVSHEHWVAVFQDKKGAQHIRLVNSDDAWKYDIQVGMTVNLCIRPYNKCKILKVLQRPI